MTTFIHPTAIVEPGAEVGDGTRIWDAVHVRSGSHIGIGCNIGEKTYIAAGVRIGDRVKVNALVYLCDGVTIEDGVMIAPGVLFTNDLYPRATTPNLKTLLPSDFGPDHLETKVREGASIGAGSVILAGVEIGRFSLVGLGSVVTRSVADFHLVRGNPAVVAGAVCRCGQPIARFDAGQRLETEVACRACGLRYAIHGERVIELTPP